MKRCAPWKSICPNPILSRWSWRCWLALLVPLWAGTHAAAAGFELHDGDRVVLVGDTLIEREQLSGYIEERLTSEFPTRNVTFRNLGWSGDTPTGISRASFDFDKPGKSFEKLKEALAAVRPTVVILGYGQANSLEHLAAPGESEEDAAAAGLRGLEEFKTDLVKLMDAVQALDPKHPMRFVLLSPIKHEDLGRPLPDPRAHNWILAQYDQALRALAAQRDCEFVSLFDLTPDRKRPAQHLTENGIHLTAFGYFEAALAVAKDWGWEEPRWRVRIAPNGAITEKVGTQVWDLQRSWRHVRFSAQDDRVPLLPPVGSAPPDAAKDDGPACELHIDGLAPGKYELKVDGTSVAVASHKEWRRGVTFRRGPRFDQAEALRQAIVEKNNLFFNRWRPQNETYLFGFRKHEQGQNAKEIPMFDPLVAAQETNIARLRIPAKHTFELVEAGPPAAPTVAPLKPVAKERLVGAADHHEPKPDFEVAPGFDVNLYAESPLLAKPTQMNFDPQGRLWVASSAVYPQIQPGQVADDKILVLEDTNGDGYAEKSTVYADGLLIPTAVMPGDGGVYVGQSTELLFFRDRKGDGHSDEKRVVLSGFGTEDTHHMVHTLRWGPDGCLYFNQSIYIHSHFETPHGVERLNSGGAWRLRPSTLDLGIYVKGFCNPWGHAFDEFGQSFFTDGAGGQGICYGLPGATFFTYASMRRELKSITPGNFPKFCGLELIRSTQFPDDWQGNAITCDFRAHRVVRFAIEEQGAGYAGHEVADLLRTTNVTFRPIDVKLGPDGALYVADWSNPIIQHGEVDFRDPRRDHEHGRIWRITAHGRPLVKLPALVHASNAELFEQLLSPNSFNQQQARRVLTERGAGIRGDLARWLKKQTSDAALLAGLWMYQSIDQVEPGVLEQALNAKDGRVRAAATRIVGQWHARLKAPVDLLARRVVDEHPRVRLEAVRALAEIPGTRSAELVLDTLNRPMDDWLDYAIWLSINDLGDSWLNAVQSGAWESAGRERQLEFALNALEPARASKVLAQVLPHRPLPREGSGPWINLIGASGDESMLTRLFEQARTGGFDDPAAVRALDALAHAARQRNLKPNGDLASLAPLTTEASEPVRVSALRLAGAWKLKTLTPKLLAVAGDKTATAGLRSAAFEALREVGGGTVVAGLEPLTAADRDPAVRREAVLTLGAMDLERAAAPAASLLMSAATETEAHDLWRSLLAIKGSGLALAKALPKTGLPPVMAKAGLRAAREDGRNEPDLVWALTRGADLESEAQTLSDAELKQLAARVPGEGDAARGERLFRRKELNCTTCHAIGGVGGKVGPDLTSIGASAQVDYLVESVLYPNRKIKEGYHSVIVETKDGFDYSGVLVSENAETLVLRNSSDQEISIAKNNIQTRQTGNSLMPSGLVDALAPAERLDLYRFLSELGKPGPYDASRQNVARAWKLLPATTDLAQFGDDRALATQFSDSKWIPASALVDGRLLKDDLLAALQARKSREPDAVYAAARFQVTKAGAIALKLNGAEGAPLWVDGQPVRGAAPDLTAGPHTLVVKLDSRRMPDALRVESPDAVFVNF